MQSLNKLIITFLHLNFLFNLSENLIENTIDLHAFQSNLNLNSLIWYNCFL